MADSYEKKASNISAPAGGAFAITKSDTTNFHTDTGAVVPRALYVGTTGTLTVVTAEGETVAFVSALGVIPIRVHQVLSTGTDASDIVGMY